MEHCFWIILAIMTGLTSGESSKFQMVVKKGTKITTYHISVLNDSSAVMKYEADQPGDSIFVNYSMRNNKTWIKTRFVKEPVDLLSYFNAKKINWKKLNKLKFNKTYEEEGEKELTILRTPGKIYLKQESGSFTYFPVIYSSWTPKLVN